MDQYGHVLLQEAGLLQYRHRFETLGYTSFAKFLGMSLEDYQTLGELVNMPQLDVLRLSVVCTKMRTEIEGTAGPGTPDVALLPSGAGSPAVPLLPSLEDRNDVDHQPVRVPTDPDCVPCLKTTHEVKLWSLRNSTLQNCSTMVDIKKSGSKCKVYRCRSLLSKRIESDPDNDHALCPYTLHWNHAVKRGTWKLNTKKSVLLHMPFCPSGQRVKTDELLHDEAFIQHVNTAKKVSGKSAVETSLGGDSGRLDGSVKVRTAWRAVKQIQHASDKDYADDWSKLSQWGPEFERINPQSRFDIRRDGEDRLVVPWW